MTSQIGNSVHKLHLFHYPRKKIVWVHVFTGKMAVGVQSSPDKNNPTEAKFLFSPSVREPNCLHS